MTPSTCLIEEKRTHTPLSLYLGLTRYFVLAIVTWLAHFLHSGQFGLYEDDWNRIPKIVGIDWHDLSTLIGSTFLSISGQGRPLHSACILFFSFVGFKCGGLKGIYGVAFLLLLTSTLLFQSFLLRVTLDRRFSFLGALAFCVFPADTTQPFLTHALGVQPAIILLLLAFHCYLAGWIKTSYVVIALVLFTYETPFLVFAVAPLLQPRPKREIRNHWLIMASLVLCVFAMRSLSAEARVSHVGVKDLLLGCLNVISGPLTCISMYVYRPITALVGLTGQNAAIVIASSLVLACIFAAPYLIGERTIQASKQVGPSPGQHPVANGRKQLLIGAYMLVLAYPLTLTTTGMAVAGRGTRAHTAAILGASILCAWGCSLLLSRPVSRLGKCAAVLGVGCFYGLLVGSGLNVQHDYALAWQEQRAFWTDLVALCPSLQDGDVIFVEPSGLRDTRQLLFLRKDLTGVPDTRQIKSLDELYRVLPYLYDFPSEWKDPPRVFRLPLHWEGQIFADGDKLRPLTIEEGYAYDPGSRSPIEPSHVIFLDTNNGHLTRRNVLVDSQDGDALQLKSDSVASSEIPKKPIYPYVISPKDHAPVSYLVK